MLGEEIPKYAPTPGRPKVWDGIAERIYYVRAIFRTPKPTIWLKSN